MSQLQAISFSRFKKETHHKHVKYTWKNEVRTREFESDSFYCNPYGDMLSMPKFLISKDQKFYKLAPIIYEAHGPYGTTRFEIIKESD